MFLQHTVIALGVLSFSTIAVGSFLESGLVATLVRRRAALGRHSWKDWFTSPEKLIGFDEWINGPSSFRRAHRLINFGVAFGFVGMVGFLLGIMAFK